MPAFHPGLTKVQLKLSIQRTRMLQEKKEAMAKKSRREIADYVAKGKVDFARIKAEGIIREDIHIELLELLELFSELLLARFPLLELPNREPDASLHEALCALIHAAPHTELRELHQLREMLMSKYGRDFALRAMENEDNCVGSRTMSKLSNEPPSPELVDLYVAEICKAYSVPFKSKYIKEEPETPPEASAATASDGAIAGGSTEKPTVAADTTAAAAQEKKEDGDVTSLEARFAALKRK